ICVQEVLQLMEKGELGSVTDAQREFLELAKRNVKRMLNNFEELLTIATQVRKVESRIKTVELKPLLEELSNDFRPFARRKRVNIVVDVSPEQEAVDTDRAKLYEVMTNLVDNAIKYTLEGTDVKLRARPYKDHVRLEVEDGGPGIPDSHRAILFDKVASLKHYRELNIDIPQKGHGLGLAISQEVIKSLGGKIGFHTQEGIGTTFYVELPRKAAIQNAAALHHHAV
ncbi:MAG: HAMP domain-containing histidine kinase, partial [Candidatus Omnitrophica bacterium]|nr:HAMP domain-containing histidine kinase [Candidatus Omnitrophota bacterium]